MPKNKTKKIIKDFQGYLGCIEEMARPLPARQKKQLNEILRSLMVLLVALRQTSNLGETVINIKDLR